MVVARKCLAEINLSLYQVPHFIQNISYLQMTDSQYFYDRDGRAQFEICDGTKYTTFSFCILHIFYVALVDKWMEM